MSTRINGVKVDQIVDFLQSGIKESQRVALRNSLVDDEGEEDQLNRFANRMTVRLNTAIKRIEELEVIEEQLKLAKKRIQELEKTPVRDSWAGKDTQARMLEEIARSKRGGEGW